LLVLNEKKVQNIWATLSVSCLSILLINVACIILFLVYNQDRTPFAQLQHGFKNLTVFCIGLSVVISYLLQMPSLLQKIFTNNDENQVKLEKITQILMEKNLITREEFENI